MNDVRKTASIFFILSLILFTYLPPVLGDGMPVYTYVKDHDEAEELYGTTFESRQLANIEYLNSTHQRIDLFLSIFSMNPEENLTVLVPFRELPEEVNMERENDSDFLENHDYDRIIEQSRKQDLARTSGRFAERTGNSLMDLGTSAVTTPLGALSLYVARTYHLDSGNGRGYGEMDAAGGGESASKDEVEEVSHYEFDGASVSVYSVSANATLDDFISVVDLGTMPAITREVVEEYREQYVAVIESQPSPPIPEEDYDWLWEVMPDTMERLIGSFSSRHSLSYEQAREEVLWNSYRGFREMVDSEYNFSDKSDNYIQKWYDDIHRWEFEPGDSPLDILEKMESLVFAVYGFTDFQGHILSVTTKLDNGDLYFPLGTSKGWNNPIQETIIIARVPGDRSLDPNLEADHTAFIGGHHCYVFEYFDANPEEDLEASIEDSSMLERTSASISEFIDFNTLWAPLFLAVIFEIFLWFFLIWLMRIGFKNEKNGKTLTLKNMRIAILNILVSAPVTYIFTVEDPFTGKKHVEEKRERNMFRLVYLYFLVINFCIILLGVFS